MLNIIKEFLNNPIVINWVAPIITGLIVIAVPSIVIRIFRVRKDTKKVDYVNQRYLNTVRPYIIQKINIDLRMIIDIRDSIIKESFIKEKYVYTPVQLKNKLLLDITEDKYISENDKKELLDFVYDVFGDLEIKQETMDKSDNKKAFLKLDKFVIIFIFCVIICAIIEASYGKNTNLSQDPIYGISYIVAFISATIIFVKYIVALPRSSVTDRTRFKDRFVNLLFEKEEEPINYAEIFTDYKKMMEYYNKTCKKRK